ncbi:acetate/propionate family kinase [Haloferula sargassicola]|uniref:Acetate kinase n=1 Tax=Haloferula sargassicola TaxID=490096 RepID=A0ABP9UUT8_9BACT
MGRRPAVNVLTVNAGSGSLKLSMFDAETSADPAAPAWQAKLVTTDPEAGEGMAGLSLDYGGRKHRLDPLSADTPDRFEALWRAAQEALPEDFRDEPKVVIHRVVHGGDRFDAAVRIDDSVLQEIERWSRFAPLHQAANRAGIDAARRGFPEIPHFAVFDTAFHRTLPAAAFTYAGPRSWRSRGIRRFGFHGISFRAASTRAAEMLGRAGDPSLPLILCHLGGGCSLCATVGGRSIDTTMGLTPLDGIAMSTRSGAIDPAILIHLMRQGMRADEIETLLNRHSGLSGLSGLPGDTRRIRPAAGDGDPDARLALDVFIHRLRAGIGSMLASLGTLPGALVFTDTIGETEPTVRTAACEAFAFLGLTLDPALNGNAVPDCDVATADSRVRALVIHSREAWQMVKECRPLLS